MHTIRLSTKNQECYNYIAQIFTSLTTDRPFLSGPCAILNDKTTTGEQYEVSCQPISGRSNHTYLFSRHISYTTTKENWKKTINGCTQNNRVTMHKHLAPIHTLVIKTPSQKGQPVGNINSTALILTAMNGDFSPVNSS